MLSGKVLLETVDDRCNDGIDRRVGRWKARWQSDSQRAATRSRFGAHDCAFATEVAEPIDRLETPTTLSAPSCL